MDISTFIAFMIFVCVMSGTPGPGNLTFMALGASTGFRSIVVPLLGALTGSAIMGICIAQGLGAMLSQANGNVTIALKLICMAYMIYLAWRVLTMNIEAKGPAKKLSFWEGFFIHPLSPKTWAMDTIAFSFYFAPTGSLWDETLIFVGGFTLGGLVFHSLWGAMGASIIKFLGQGRMFQLFTASMAGLMVVSTAWSLWLQGNS